MAINFALPPLLYDPPRRKLDFRLARTVYFDWALTDEAWRFGVLKLAVSKGIPCCEVRSHHNDAVTIMAFAQPLLVVGCTNRFALCTKQRIGLGCAKGQ